MGVWLRAMLFAYVLAAIVLSLPREPAAAADRLRGAATALESRLKLGLTSSGVPLLSLEALRLFYAQRGQRPAWTAAGRPSPQVDELLQALRRSEGEGLRSADYHLAALDDLRGRLGNHAGGGPESAGDLIDLDVLLSDAFLLYAGHLAAGRVNPVSIEPEWNIPGRGPALTLLLSAALERRHLAETLAPLPPARADYRRLREALAAHRAFAASGGWPVVPPGRAMRAGARGGRVAALRLRLAATGDLPRAEATGNFFDAPLAEAVRRFQGRHGLDTDAVVGDRTIAALNVTALQRARQIEANLERLRWLPPDLGPRHLLVNIPDFRLTLRDGEGPALTMRVIAGRQSRRTPFFSGKVTSIVVNPPWIVPEKLAREDKLPQILDDRDFFARERFTLLARAGKTWREIDPGEVDWARLPRDRFPYRLRQEPGPGNALGRLKFQIPNPYEIYLHDTPAHELFSLSERAFSSGCIRVERALDLAERLLAPDASWPRERIEAAIATGKTVEVPLARPMPAYLLYATAWVDADGTVQFREDIYGRDAALLEALERPLAPR
jgi:murein L,D-transpeptidase YcbB/YkuD